MIEKQDCGWEYKPDVKFKATRSKANNKICNFCHKGTRVTMLRYPITLYYGRGSRLTSKYSDIWMCDDCRDKMIKAIQNPKEET